MVAEHEYTTNMNFETIEDIFTTITAIEHIADSLEKQIKHTNNLLSNVKAKQIEDLKAHAPNFPVPTLHSILHVVIKDVQYVFDSINELQQRLSSDESLYKQIKDQVYHIATLKLKYIQQGLLIISTVLINRHHQVPQKQIDVVAAVAAAADAFKIQLTQHIQDKQETTKEQKTAILETTKNSITDFKAILLQIKGELK